MVKPWSLGLGGEQAPLLQSQQALPTSSYCTFLASALLPPYPSTPSTEAVCCQLGQGAIPLRPGHSCFWLGHGTLPCQSSCGYPEREEFPRMPWET